MFGTPRHPYSVSEHVPVQPRRRREVVGAGGLGVVIPAGVHHLDADVDTGLTRVRLDRRGVVGVVEEVPGRDVELQVLGVRGREQAPRELEVLRRCLIDGSVDANPFQNGLSFPI